VVRLFELESLGIRVSRLNEFNDEYEIQHLADNLKQAFYQAYKSSTVFTDCIDPILNSK
jgi:hypothetical protein